MLFAPPLALALGIVGIVIQRPRGLAIAGTVISGTILLLYLAMVVFAWILPIVVTMRDATP